MSQNTLRHCTRIEPIECYHTFSTAVDTHINSMLFTLYSHADTAHITQIMLYGFVTLKNISV